jgi:hypothetical protein
VQAAEHRHRRLDRVPAEEDHDIARLHTPFRQADRHPDRGAAQLIKREHAIVEDQRRLLGVLLRTACKVAPQVSVTPVSLGVIAISLGLERHGRHCSPPVIMLSGDCHSSVDAEHGAGDEAAARAE